MRQTVDNAAYVEIGALQHRFAEIKSAYRPPSLVFHSVILTPGSLTQSFCHAPSLTSSCGAYPPPPPLIEVTFSVHVEISRRRAIFLSSSHPRRNTVANNLSVRLFILPLFFFPLLSFFSSRRLPVNAVLFRWGVLQRLRVNLKYHSKGRVTPTVKSIIDETRAQHKQNTTNARTHTDRRISGEAPNSRARRRYI